MMSLINVSWMHRLFKSFMSLSSMMPMNSKRPSRPSFPNKPRHNINLHEMSAYEFLQVHSHELEPDPEPEETTSEDLPAEATEPEPSDTLLINAAKGSRPSPLPPGDIRRVLSKNSKCTDKVLDQD
jgi:hypothetical protein